MNKRQLKNLAKLTDFIEQNIKDKQFDMETYRKNNENEVVKFKGLNDCGTIGCALGWAPFALSIIWVEYNSDAFSFNDLSDKKFGVTMGDEEWVYLFSSLWAGKHKNQRKAFINRARALIEAEGDMDRVNVQMKDFKDIMG